MSTSKLLSKIQSITASNSNNHRLTKTPLKKLEDLPEEARAVITELLSSSKDLGQVSLGVLIYAVISANKPIFILSMDNLQKLINETSSMCGFKRFDIGSVRTGMTIYGQVTGLMVSSGLFKILQASQKGSKVPAVIELIDSDLLKHLSVSATEELRSIIINSTRKQVYENTKIQIYKDTSIQEYNNTRHSEIEHEIQDEIENEIQVTECFQDVTNNKAQVLGLFSASGKPYFRKRE